MRMVNDQVPYAARRRCDRDMLLRLEQAASSRQGRSSCRCTLLGVARDVGAPRCGSLSPVDLVLALGDALPSGIYTGEGIEEYVRKALSDPDRTDDFRLLERELYLAATDLDTCERIVLGAEGWDDVPISSAVRASTALPMVYAAAPRASDRELVDGGIVSTTNLDIAVEAGAKFIVVVNPLVPVRQRLLEGRSRRCSAPACAACRTWASRRSATRRSSCSPTSACTRWRATGRSATRASTSS